MTEEEYNKLVHEREEYRKKKTAEGNKFVKARKEYIESIGRIVNDSDDSEVFPSQGIMEFYDDEETRFHNFIKRIKQKIFK